MPALARLARKAGWLVTIALSQVVEPHRKDARASSRVRRKRSNSIPHTGKATAPTRMAPEKTTLIWASSMPYVSMIGEVSGPISSLSA